MNAVYWVPAYSYFGWSIECVNKWIVVWLPLALCSTFLLPSNAPSWRELQVYIRVSSATAWYFWPLYLNSGWFQQKTHMRKSVEEIFYFGAVHNEIWTLLGGFAEQSRPQSTVLAFFALFRAHFCPTLGPNPPTLILLHREENIDTIRQWHACCRFLELESCQGCSCRNKKIFVVFLK